MGKKDIGTYEYMSDKNRFADLFNFYLYGGKKVILPEKLRELDTKELVIPHDNTKASQKVRDILKELRAMEDENARYLLLGIENQSEIHYAMPVKNMIMDAARYVQQAKDIAKSHKENHENKHLLPGEYLSSLHKDDKLTPIITLVVFWSAETWDGPKSLHEMFSVQNKDILKYVADYKLNLFSPQMIEDETFPEFETELAEVFKFIKYSKDKGTLKLLLKDDEAFHHLGTESAVLIETVLHTKFKIDRDKEVINMCKAEEDWLAEESHNLSVEIAKSLIKLGNNPLEDIASATKLPLDEVKELAKQNTPVTNQ